MSLNQSTEELFTVEAPRVRKRMVVIDGENFSRHEFIRIIKAGRNCGCGACFDCMVMQSARKSGV
jgi:hypothetical protein